MCLAIPGLIRSIEDREAEVDLGGVSRRVSLWLTPEAKIGDWVLIHTGYAIGIVSAEDAQETLKLFEEMARAGEDQSATR